jgi:hypothetical protein
VFQLPGWSGSTGSVGYWIRPVDWTSTTEKHVVMLQTVDGEDTNFTFYKYYQSKGLWFCGTKKEPNGKSQVRIFFRNEDILQNWKPEQWNHVGFVWERGNFAKTYVNGVCVGQMQGDFWLPDSFTQLALGRSGKLYGKSVIRDVRISHRALTDTDMQKWYAPESLDFADETVLPFANVNSPPHQDGIILEGEYSSRISGFVEAESVIPEWVPGMVYTGADSEFIYFAASLPLPDDYIPSSVSSKKDDPRQVSQGDLFIIFIQPGESHSPKLIHGKYLTIAPNGNLYDAEENVNWEERSCQRNPEWDSGAVCDSRVSQRNWSVELKLPRDKLKISEGDSFRMSLGFKLGNRRLALVPHPVWFDHYQGFVQFRPSPVGVHLDWEGLKFGLARGEFAIENKTSNKLKMSISTAFHSPTIRKVASGMVVEQLIGEEIHVDSGKKLWQENKELQLPPKSSGNVKFEHRISSPGSYMLHENISIGSETILSRQVPFSYHPPLSVKLSPVPSKDSILMEYNCSGISSQELKQIQLNVRFSKDAGVVMEQRFTVKAENSKELFSMEQLASGTYEVDAELIQNNNVIGAVKTSFTKRAIENWQKNPIGLEALKGDWVPNPWIPLKRSGDVVSLWGRKHDYSGTGILNQIYSQDQALLSDAVAIKYGRGQQEKVLAIKERDFCDEQPGRIKMTQRGGDKQFNITVSQEIEFDGFNKIDVELIPVNPTKVEQLWIEIPFKRPRYQYIKGADHGSYVLGEVQNGSWTDFPMFWVGDDRVGCFVFAESFRGWQSNTQKPRITFSQKGSDYVLKLLIVNEPALLNKSLKFTFGVQAGPVKPFFQGWRDMRPQGWGWAPQPVNLFIVDPRNWSSTYSRPVPLNWRRMNDMVTQVHKDRQRVYPYLTPFSISTYDIIDRNIPVYRWSDKIPTSAQINKKKDSRPVEEYWYYAQDWDLVPRRITGDGTDRETTEMAYVDPDSSWTDYFVGSVHEILKRTDVDGVYFDLPYPKENKNKSKNLTYVTPDGVEEGTYQYFAARDLYKRLYWVFEKLRGPNRKPYILGHSGRYFFPLSAFWDVEFHGEEIKPSTPFEFTQYYLQNTLTGAPIAGPASADSQRSYNSVTFRCSYGKQFGMPQMLLPQYGHKILKPHPELSREILSFTFLHDVLLWPAYIDDATVYKFWNQVEVSFGMGDTLFYSYWENGVVSEPESIRVSYWKKTASDEYLIAIANWGDTSTEASIRLPDFMKTFPTALDMEKEKPVTISDPWKITVPAHDLRVFILKSTKRK